MRHVDDSPLAEVLDEGDAQGASDVVAIARRHRTVTATRLPPAAISGRELAFRRAVEEMVDDRGAWVL